MWFFWMLVLIVLFTVAALAWWGIGITVPENARKTVRGILVLFDVVSVLLLMAGRHLLWMTEPVLKYGMLVLTVVWMAELFFGLFALFARPIYKFIYNE